MLLLHQAGSVKIGEVVRYTLTYIPANDRILPTPSHLYIKIKNTSAIPLRAAWVHGPYALHVSAYSANFNPHQKVENPERDGTPQYEPVLKAGGSWQAKLPVPEDIRETGADLGRRQSGRAGESADHDEKGRVTWVIEIASQILFSNSASVNFELLAGRDERSLDLGFAAVASHGHGGPGQVQYLATDKDKRRAREKGHVQTAGVYSKAVKLVVEDTDVLWDKPALPSRDDGHESKRRRSGEAEGQDQDTQDQSRTRMTKKKVHLVVVTHGLHSNVGADMLFLKESIDATVAQARKDARKRKESYRASQRTQKQTTESGGTNQTADQGDGKDDEQTATAPLSGGQEEVEDEPENTDEEEETIVRGFTGNAVRTENGIQYLGKRLAKYILRFTYPDQPYLPVKKGLSKSLTDPFKSETSKAKRYGVPAHSGSSVRNADSIKALEELPYTFTSISFIGHSLGGLIQTYAIAYIQKHNPDFFQQIKPVNFICMAAPMLGLSNENPMYVKFALDFGLVGRTGQDLGLTWRAPTLARGGWNAMIGGLGSGQKDQEKQADPTVKPLLRILPTGPAHQVLLMFRNRTLYSNVVNDGIVPLRTSCLLFLDWRGLDKVDKARRENGLIGTVAEWGWAELTGQNLSKEEEEATRDDRRKQLDEVDDDENVGRGDGESVPLPDEDETTQDNKRAPTRGSSDDTNTQDGRNSISSVNSKSTQQDGGMWDTFMSFFRPSPASSSSIPRSKKTKKALTRGQTIFKGEDELPEEVAEGRGIPTRNPTMRPHMGDLNGDIEGSKRPLATRGDSLIRNENGELEAPPKTSIFESAGDILHPPMPSKKWLTDPSSRARTIFHDRVYHPEDIPPQPTKRQSTRFGRSTPPNSSPSANSQDSADSGGIKVEEKIARAYHRDLSWRKVLVRLEPDAHNNMIVRRMFANAYGWPVVKHLCDTHFADTFAAKTRDEDEPARERAKPMGEAIAETGEEVAGQTANTVTPRSHSEMRESRDELAALAVVREGAQDSYSSNRPGQLSRQGSAVWDDAFFEGTDDDDDSDVDERHAVARFINPRPLKKPEQSHQRSSSGTQSKHEPRTPTVPYTDGHRGLAPTSPSTTAKSAASTQSTFDTASMERPVVASRLSEEPEALGSTAEVGLRKSVEQQASPTKTRGGASRPASGNLAEAVARTSGPQD